MTDDPLDLRLLAACAVAREAGRLALDYFRNRERLEIELKGPQDLVSRADREVEELVRARLGAAFPGDAFLGEEGGGAGGGGADRLWVIDPIDGTTNFLRGMPYWSTVIGYMVEGRTEIGVTYDPVHDELFAARRGHGATRDGRPIRVSDRREPGEAAISLAYTFKLEREVYIRLVDGAMRHGFEHRRLGSTALMLCHVADGRLDACATLYANLWDVVAGLILVREAGGVSSDFLDGAGPTEPNRILACTPALRPILEELVGIKAA